MLQVPTIVVGVDLVCIQDVAESIARFGERYIRRMFTEAEVEYCERSPHAANERFAARIAAKEATMKVLRPLESDAVPWGSIEVRRSEEGWCDIALMGAAAALARRAGVGELAVSLSHGSAYAIATVIGTRTGAAVK